MSLLKKFKKMLLGDTESPSKIKVTEVSPQKNSKEGNRQSAPKGGAERKPSPKKYSDDRKPEAKKTDERRSDGKGAEYKKSYDKKSDDRPRYDDKKRERVSDWKKPEDSAGAPRREYAERPEWRPEKSADDAAPRAEKAYAPRYERPSEGGRGRGGYSNDRRRRRGGGSGRSEESVAGLNPDNIRALDFGNWSVDEFIVPEEEGKKRFHDFDIPLKVMRGVFDAGYQYCTPIQALILPEAFKGTDVSGRAQTGTGKTAAFLVTAFRHLLGAEPKKERTLGSPRALIMAPTRELVIQIEKDARVIGKYCGLTIQSVFGGIHYEKQRRQIENRNIDILVATPGRLLDFQEQGVLKLDSIEILVIDEADRMLDMGFIPDMRKIINSTPARGIRQTMLFSATLTPEILRLASQWTKDPLSFEVKSKELTADAIEQRAYIVANKDKFPLMYNMLVSENLSRVIVFGNRRDEVSKLADMFKLADISCGLLSGDVSQAKRIKTLEDLRNGRIRVLCATDVAARGLHVDDVTHVFNFTLPDDPEDYVHRIGRTGRAGATGVSVIFATEEDAYLIPKIEKFTGHKLNYITPAENMTTLPADLAKIMPIHRSFSSRPRGGAPRGGGRSSGGYGGGRSSGGYGGSNGGGGSRPPRRGGR